MTKTSLIGWFPLLLNTIFVCLNMIIDSFNLSLIKYKTLSNLVACITPFQILLFSIVDLRLE